MKDKGSFVSVSTCLALHAPRCFVALCAHLFKGLPFSLHLSLSLSPSLSCPPPFPLVICFSPVGFGIPFIESALFSSYPFQRMGPERQNGWLWVLLSLSLLTPSLSLSLPQLLTTLVLAPCHTMMSWLLFALGVPIDSLCLLHTLYISLFHPPLIPLNSTPVSLRQFLSQILLPLQRRLGDLGMFGCCLVHPRYILDTQTGTPSTLQIQLQLLFKHFNILLLSLHHPLLWSAFIFIWLLSLCFVSRSVWEVIIDPLIM